MKILFVSGEVAPFLKTGGLADVASALPKEQAKKGNDIRVIMPKYRQINPSKLEGLEKIIEFNSQVNTDEKYVGVEKLKNRNVINYFVDNKYYFNRNSVYENDDRNIQFAYFCYVVLEMLKKIDFKPDIIHVNDWQTGLIPVMLKKIFSKDEFYKDIKTVYTIHNLRYQGLFSKELSKEALKFIGEDIVEDNINYTELALKYADKITTVSDTYAKEITTEYFGEGLDWLLRERNKDLIGIVNGIDYDDFNPATDNDIYENYDYKSLNKKDRNKTKLQQEMGLEADKNIPVIGLISRLVPQKGLDLIAAVIEDLLKKHNFQLIVLGTGMKKYEDMFEILAKKYPKKVASKIMYDAKLAQKIYAGSDMFLMPSQFEPCGLGQLISLRYGTIPIVRETGGLNDTVKSYNDETGVGNGFTFRNYNAHDMMHTIERALYFYRDKQRIWKILQKRAMNSDYSWNHAANEYIKLYKELK
ncbi:MAG: glycogen synthase GlgA [Fusobacteriota bacterium]